MWRRVPVVDVSQQNHRHFVKAGLRSLLYPPHNHLRDRIPNFILRENPLFDEQPEEFGYDLRIAADDGGRSLIHDIANSV